MKVKITTVELGEIDKRISDELRLLKEDVLNEYMICGGNKRSIHSFIHFMVHLVITNQDM